MTTPLDPRFAARIRRRLLSWYDSHRRDLPWRRTADPYRIWLSEIMLQQTQVATVIPYYERFVRRLPTVAALAAAPPDEVMRLWAGLGYYSRARNLHRAARVVAEQRSGRFPQTADELRALPGVGRYTAGAIASIAFGQRAPVVDGNVARVLARLLAVKRDVATGAGREHIWELAGRLLPRRRVGDFNQALMELGAAVCLPGAAARCSVCPLKRDCAAADAGIVAKLPIPSTKTPVKQETHVVAAIRSGDRWLFVRRPPGGLWGGLWSLPSVVNGHGTSEAAARRIARDLHIGRVRVRRAAFCDVAHRLTHREIRFIGHVCTMNETSTAAPRRGGGSIRWMKLNSLNRLGLSTAMKHVVSELRGVSETD